MSLAMLRAEAAQGVETVVLTPHFYAHRDRPDAFLKRRQAAEDALRQAMASSSELPQIVMGAEVAYFRGMSETQELRKFCIGRSDYILVELPAPPWKEQVYRDLQGIMEQQRLFPIIAHIDRYLPLFGADRMMARLLRLPVMIQANAGFFTKRATARTARRLLEEGKIHLLGSDCHDRDRRPPNLGMAVESIRKSGKTEVLSRIAENQNEIFSQI